MAPEAGLGCCQPHPGGWHSSRSKADDAVFLSGQSVEGRSDSGHFGPADQGCFTAKPARAGPRASRRCARFLRRPSGEA
jgi:hypothetical protein